MQNSIQINLIPHLRTKGNQIIEPSHIVPAVKWSCTIVVEHKGPLTRLWSSNEAQHWGGVGPRAGVCVCLGTIHYTIRGSRRIRYVGVCVWMRSLRMKQNCSPIAPTQTHTYSIHTGAWAHKQSHTLTWVSMATPNKHSVHVVTPPQQKRGEKPRQRGKSGHKSEIESESGDEGNSKGHETGFCSCICFTLCTLYVLFIAETFK